MKITNSFNIFILLFISLLNWIFVDLLAKETHNTYNMLKLFENIFENNQAKIYLKIQNVKIL